MKYFFRLLLLIVILLNVGNVSGVLAQESNAANLKSDNLSDSQVRDMMKRAEASGLSDDQLRSAAIARGLSEDEANKLQTRITAIRAADSGNGNSATIDTGKNTVGDRKVTYGSDGRQNGVAPKPTAGIPVFGSELFSNSNLTFEPSLRIATPQNYVLGPDDQVIINVYGNSQVDWNLKISPDGNIQIPGIGLVNVGGKTIEQATGIIKSKLAQNRYAVGHGTSVSVSLGNIRSIKVIMVGQLVKPASYTLSSLSTVFNALYAAGGPNDNGSYRQIQVIRNNKMIKTLDTYDFLLKGSQKDNIFLKDGDIINVPTYKVRVTLNGQVKKVAKYEVLPGETFQDVVNFSGGFSDQAYTATVKVLQLTDKERRVTDINNADFNTYIPRRGDIYIIDEILERYENRVTIKGALFRPGQFQLDNGLTLSRLIEKAGGLKEDAFTGRGYITRLKPDNTTELIPFDVKGVLNKTKTDILLQREDIVNISSIFDLRDNYTVTINGEVRKGGIFAYADSMSVEDLVIQAGGFTESASPKRIEVARRINYSDPNEKNSPIASVSIINVDENFKLNSKPFVLHPFDVVSIYSLPGYQKQKTVKVEGEVLYPGSYTISSKNEKISDLLKRAGGLTASADVEGGTLKRTNQLGIDAEKGKIDANELQQEKVQRLQHLQKTFRDSLTDVNEQLRNDFVGIDLKRILNNPGTKIDLILEEGDVVRIPKEQQIVKIDGEVLFPSAVVYNKSKTFADYVDNAGGFSPGALRHRSYVVYPNGTVKGTKKFLFFNSYPNVKAGSEIVVPKKPVRRGLSTAESIGLLGSLASLGAIIIAVLNITKN
ncbi:SLBB domain-containing protein [Mucilaginibacter paludis]|uniref:Polysaccharide export protein n=1 Tax=Mucilaginibacter paludis DSM 18603 TaxID=714943 RepID=H1YCN4_9SPHI|nr:SLBB domain-containing protein [Mucilaginibacter paludis]EHQ24221.1 polysaccharide export protein [Mucilaginibacter paludis DSM 18603]